MLFNSYVFLFAFLPAVLVGWWGLSRWKPPRLAFLTGASWFFFGSWNGIGAALGLHAALPSLHIVLPIGISFYTFNSMSYTIDIFRRRIDPTRSVLEYTTFVGLFPHLIAGPIVRFTDLAEQLKWLR